MKLTRFFATFALAAVALCAVPVSAHGPPRHDSALLHPDAGCALAPEAPVAAVMVVDNSACAPAMRDTVLVLIDAPAVGYRLHFDPGRDIA